MNFFEQFRKLNIGAKFFMFGDKFVYCKIGVKRAQCLNHPQCDKFEIDENTFGIIRVI